MIHIPKVTQTMILNACLPYPHSIIGCLIAPFRRLSPSDGAPFLLRLLLYARVRALPFL